EFGGAGRRRLRHGDDIYAAAGLLSAVGAAVASVASVAGAAGSGAGASRADITWATTTATITTGITLRPSVPSNTVASSVEVSGRPSIAADIAPMPMATPGTSERPGRSEAAMPAAAPMNSAGNTGPPRKLDSDRA